MLIGINGNKGAGKDTVGKYLVDNYGFEIKKFAAKLYESAAKLLEVTPEFLDEHKNNDMALIGLVEADLLGGPARSVYSSMTVRRFLQLYGTEAHRNVFGNDFWVNALFEDFDPWDGKNYVVTDARFPNELLRIKELNGFNLRVTRRVNTVTDTHISESAPPLALIDFLINNDGSFEELYKQVDAFMADYPMIEKNVAEYKTSS